MKTIVYVDGFNLFYGAIKGTTYKWLDIRQMCQLLLPTNNIIGIKYFTAPIKIWRNDSSRMKHQQIYLRALRTLPDTEIILGHFLQHEVKMPVAHPGPGIPDYIHVIKTEEKGSDVNIASHMINDGYKGNYQVAILVSNDSDLVEPIKILRQELKIPVIVLNPFIKTPSFELRKYASFIKPIRQGVLLASQFTPTLTDSNGVFSKPNSW